MMDHGATPTSPHEIVQNDPCLRIQFDKETDTIENRRVGDHAYTWVWVNGAMSHVQCQTCLKVKVAQS